MAQSFFSFGQSFPTVMPDDGLVLHGKVSTKYGVRSADQKTIYTVNWFVPDAIYHGKGTLPDSIPVLTMGGIADEGLLVVSHAIEIQKNYDYMIALQPCDDCVSDLVTWNITGLVGEFSSDSYVQAQKIWTQKARITDIPEIGCTQDASTLFLSFGNIHLAASGDSVLGYLDIKCRTNIPDKALNSLAAQLKYKTNVLGVNAISSQNVSILPSDPSMESVYTSTATDIAEDKASLSMINNGLTGTAILIEQTEKSFARIKFKTSLQGLLSIPQQLSDLFTLENVQASYICDREVFYFRNISIDESSIGVVLEGLAPSITYTFDDVEFDSTTSKYQFTIFAASEFDTRLIQSDIYFSYSPTAFFPDQVITGNAQIVNAPGTIVTDYPQYAPIFGDLTSNTLILLIGSTSPITPEPLAFLGPTPKPLVRIEMTVDDCTVNPDLHFNEVDMQEGSYYDDNLMPFFLAYDPVIANDQEQVIPCGCNPVVVTAFNPPQIVAGANEVLTITGTGFGVFERGSNPGSGGDKSSVLFYNGDYVAGIGASPEYIAASKEDIVNWTDTEIKVKVPSTNFLQGVNGPASTGKIIVRNRCNIIDSSANNLNIPHSLLNFRLADDGVAKRLGLRNDNGLNGEQDGYEFSYDTSVFAAGLAINIPNAFENALASWCAATNIRFKRKIGTAPFGTGLVANDGFNIVALGGGAPGTQAAVITTQSYFTIDCGGNDPNNELGGFIMTDIDMRVTGSFAATGTQARAVRVFEHELGHAHMLNHARCFNTPSCDDPMPPAAPLPNSGPLMDPQGRTGLKSADASGGNKVFPDSESIINFNNCFNSAGAVIFPTPIQTGGCNMIVSTKTPQNKIISQVTPNPAASSINIIVQEENLSFRFSDMNGRTVISGKLTAGENHLNIESLPSGVYLLTLSSNRSVSSYKIVKI